MPAAPTPSWSDFTSAQSRSETFRSSSAFSARSFGAHLASASAASCSASPIRFAKPIALPKFGFGCWWMACCSIALAVASVELVEADTVPPSGTLPSTLSPPAGKDTEPSAPTVHPAALASSRAASSFRLAAAMSYAKAFSAVPASAHSVWT